ncbi:Sec39 domain-containing protein [Tricladium varicosporioides]|nr:Sec39 domain-containing protein [Hymenoscyphus varicosporioides]
MAGSEVSPAKVILLAVQLSAKANIAGLETLISQNKKTLHTEIVLRILLSHLPESLESAKYVPLLQRLISDELLEDTEFSVATFELDQLTDTEAKRKARKLHLLPLTSPYDSEDEPSDPFIRFLVLRALRIDENTGLITQLPELLHPFLHLSSYLRTWTISTILPLLRLNYEYHPETPILLTLPKFEDLNNKIGVDLLLSQTGKRESSQGITIARDLRGLVGPWTYGDTRWKRRKPMVDSKTASQTVIPLDEARPSYEKYRPWEEVFKWMVDQANISWRTAVDAIEYWDGPGDVDLGEYGDGSIWLDEDEQQYLERRYARAALASAYSISAESEESLIGIYNILSRVIALMDRDRIPEWQSSLHLLSPVTDIDHTILSRKNAAHLRNALLNEENPLTCPKENAIRFLHALVISALLCTKSGLITTVREVGELALLQEAREQRFLFTRLMLHVGNGPKGDDKYWVRKRNEILWLRSWGAEEISEEGTDTPTGKGIFGKLSKDYIEAEILKLLLGNTRYDLAQSIYETSPEKPLSRPIVVDTVLSAAMNAYDNATNANKTRGGIKKCQDIMQAFPDTLNDSLKVSQLESLVTVTHLIGQYRLVFKQGEPFKPVTLRVHGDPISILGKVLEQNPKSYTKINNFVDMGRAMAKAGLTVRDIGGESTLDSQKVLPEQLLIAEKRVVSMCIDAALAEDDFETAYSYVVTRLKIVAGPSHSRTPEISRKFSGLVAEVPPKQLDDWSWRAALQAGKYRRTAQTVKPSHLGNSTSNLEIRHLEQRMECLSQALRLAPKATLQEILNVYRRCEEELETQVRQEAEQEEAWDEQGDQAIPGGFGTVGKHNNTASPMSRAAEEAPMSLFDLSRASMARAQSGFSALASLRGNPNEHQRTASGSSTGGNNTPREGTSDATRVRKRDQLKNAAVGGLASGVGWLIGAQPAPVNAASEDDDDDDDHW